MGVTRINQLADHEKARFNEWADKWIEIGLRTGPADRPKFEAAVRECYRFAGIDWPGVVVWVPSPLVLAFAAPAAAVAIELESSRTQSRRRSRRDCSDAVRGAVRDAVGGAVRDAVGGAVRGAVGDDQVRRAVMDAIQRRWASYIGGQLWAGGSWWYGGAFTSFFREVCDLELKDSLWDRGRAYEATIESACWWWPHRRFVMVCERPTVIHRELANPSVTRGWGSHRLHCETGPAVAWPDGWGVYAIHGVRVPAWLVETPAADLDPRVILKEQNVEVRREIVRKVGIDRVCQALGARCVDKQGDYELLLLDLQDGRQRPYLKMLNASLPGVWHVEGVHPDCTTVEAAINWRAYGDTRQRWTPTQLT